MSIKVPSITKVEWEKASPATPKRAQSATMVYTIKGVKTKMGIGTPYNQPPSVSKKSKPSKK